jgi:hypothetical protein
MSYVIRRVEARLIVAGHITSAFRESLTQAIDDLGMSDHVAIIGEVPHAMMPELIARATICVAPTAPESRSQPMATLPTKLLEYMACRRAVIAPRRGTTAAVIDSGVNGLLFTPGDPGDLAHKLLRLIDEPALRLAMADAGYQMVRWQHTASAVRRSLRKAYEALLSQESWQHLRHRGVETPVLSVASLTEEVGPVVSGEEAADHTDEYELELPFAQRAQPVEAEDAAVRTAEDAWTPVEGAMASPVVAPAAASPGWLNADTGENAVPPLLAIPDELDGGDEREGTPVDVRPAPPGDDEPLDGSFVAGEVEVNVPRPGQDEPAFLAVSVLLGNLHDDTGNQEP